MNLIDGWRVKVDQSVWKVLSRIPHKDASRIQSIIRTFTGDPYSGDTDKMKGGEEIWRRRIGSYRILYEILVNERIVIIHELKRRGSKTY